MFFINSEKGKYIFENIKDKVIYFHATKEECKQNVLLHPTHHNKNRDMFLCEYMESGFKKIEKKYTQEGWKLRWKIRIAKILNKATKWLR